MNISKYYIDSLIKDTFIYVLNYVIFINAFVIKHCVHKQVFAYFIYYILLIVQYVI